MQEPRPVPLSIGQGLFRGRLKTAHEFDLRRLIVLCSWLVALVALSSPQLIPIGAKLSTAWSATLLGAALTTVVVIGFVCPRLDEAWFLRVEKTLVMITWGVTAIVVYAAGGVDGPYIFFYVLAMIYSAYFFARSQLSLAHIAIGSLAAALPIAYDYQAALADGFVPKVGVALVVWWWVCFTIGYVQQLNERGLAIAEQSTHELARIDSLTGVLNCRAFACDLDATLERAAACDASQSPGRVPHVPVLLHADIEDFERVNALLGRSGGDELISAVAEALREAVGDQGSVYRIGGDEFAVLLPAEAACDAAALTARCVDRVRALDSDGNYSRHGVRVSACIGYAVWRPGVTAGELIAAADRELTSRKNAKDLRAADVPREHGLVAVS